jgi:hypothetical protein
MSDEVDRAVRRTKFMVYGGMALAALGVGAYYLYGYLYADFAVVNASSQSGLTVYVDGAEFQSKIPGSVQEDRNASRVGHLRAGTHKVETKDASGKVVDSQTIEVKGGVSGYLYAPAHDKSVCFGVAKNGYGSWGSMSEFHRLDATKSFWPIEDEIHDWFSDTPQTVVTNNSASVSFLYAVRQFNCADKHFK